MATLTLDKTWVSLFTTGDSVAGWRTADDDGDEYGVQARVATYAGGRQRGITTEGVSGTWSVSLRGISTADTEKLRTWLGQTVLVRDNRGRKMWGLLATLPRRTWKEQLDLYDVTVTIQLVTVVEAV